MTHSTDYRARYGDWALVVGASEGLGEALARDIARRGMNVAMVARREPKLAEAARRVSADFGVQTRAIVADLADPDMLNVLETGLGGVDVDFLIYNCAAENGGEFLEQDLQRHLTNITVNCTAPTILTHHYGRRMVKRGKGGIVISSSLAGVAGLYNWVSYGASKAYEMILGEGLWYELKDHGVGATTLMVGSTYTPSFQASQAARGAPFAETRTPENLPAGAPLPQEPEDASANLFAQIDKEWIPLVYGNPRDEASYEAGKSKSLIERITGPSDATRASHMAGRARAAAGG
jgi:short-subunit dehydrogenase